MSVWDVFLWILTRKKYQCLLGSLVDWGWIAEAGRRDRRRGSCRRSDRDQKEHPATGWSLAGWIGRKEDVLVGYLLHVLG